MVGRGRGGLTPSARLASGPYQMAETSAALEAEKVAFSIAGLSAWLGQTAIGVAAIGAAILGIVKALLDEKK